MYRREHDNNDDDSTVNYFFSFICVRERESIDRARCWVAAVYGLALLFVRNS